MDEQKRVQAILRALRRDYSEVECALRHENAFQLLVATILSAQCTDVRVNMVTKGLFAKWGGPEDLAEVPLPLLEAEVRSTGFFRNKAKNIQGSAQMILARFGGEVPRSMEELLELPGVARKTANVVLGTAYGLAVGVVVDTHVGRLARRLGLTTHKDPVRVEQELMQKVPKPSWIWLSHALIWHGRRVCPSRRPRCSECRLARNCPSAGEV